MTYAAHLSPDQQEALCTVIQENNCDIDTAQYNFSHVISLDLLLL